MDDASVLSLCGECLRFGSESQSHPGQSTKAMDLKSTHFGETFQQGLQEGVTTKLRVTKISKLCFVRLKLRNRRHIPIFFCELVGEGGDVLRITLSQIFSSLTTESMK